MTPARWYFDFISPFAYLQWRRLREQNTLALTPVPMLFAAVLEKLGHKGPAEIPEKRRFTYRTVVWRARRDGIALRFPPAHPFNPLAALRLAVLLDARADVIDAIFEHLWERGEPGDSARALAPVAMRFGVADIETALTSNDVKASLRANTEAALARGVFGVPTIEIGRELFWGDDATEMALDYARGAFRDDDVELQRVDHLPEGIKRV
jgi:2-hydroxychromene-2-carboxylate isomerase